MRRSAGQVAIALNIVFGIFIVGSLGMVSYEMSRILLAREQLRHCLELTSLGGGVSLASSSLTGAAAQTQAKTVAMNILKKNSVLGQSLNTTAVEVGSIAAMNPSPGQVNVYFEFIDPITKLAVASGTDTGVLKVHGAYAYPLFSGGFGAIGVSTYTVVSEATAGMPAVDVIVLMNTSGSLDDQTKVTMIRRYWDPVSNDGIVYTIPTPGGVPSEGPLANLVCPPIQGSQVNAMEPQNLDAAGNPKTSSCPKEFSEAGTQGHTVPLRGFNDNSPPGDTPPTGGVSVGGLTTGPGYGTITPGVPGLYTFGNITMALPGTTGAITRAKPRIERVPEQPQWWKNTVAALPHILEQPAEAHWTSVTLYGPASYNPWSADASMFTDLVVNLDGNNHFAGYTDPAYSSYPFPTIDYVVEAARGGMENSGTTPNAWTSNTLNAAAQPGYQDAYMQIAYRRLEPLNTINKSVNTFLTKLAQSSDCHVGLIAYNERAGNNPTDTMSAPAVSYLYTPSGNVNYLLPQIPLSLANNNLKQVSNLLVGPVVTTQPMLMPNGGSNLPAALEQAMANFNSTNSRPGAMKAIVVLTDQVPTRDLLGNAYPVASSNAGAFNECMALASQARYKGIPIFVVGLAQNSSMAALMASQFDDTQPTPGTSSGSGGGASGIVGAAAAGGSTQIDTWVDPQTTYGTQVGKLNNVVRQLVTLVGG